MFVSVVANVPTPIELIITQVVDHVRLRSNSQLISSISRVSKNYSNILMVLLFQNSLYYQH